MIDTHEHIFDNAFNEDYDLVLTRAKANLDCMLLVGFSRKTNSLVAKLSKGDKFLKPTYGIHPSEANSNFLDDLEYLENFIKNNKCYAIGECGLDYHYDGINIEYQKALFRGQIELSIKYDLPLIIHSRDAALDTLEIIKEYPKAYGVMHCYSGSLEMANEYIKRGFYISLGGPVTFKNAKEPKRVAENIPLDRILIETDSPYLAPTPYRGKRNEPSYVLEVAKEIARIRNISVEEIDSITTNNAKKLFKLEE